MKSTRQCYICGKPGHIAQFCRENYYGNTQLCYRCHRPGHFARDCDKNSRQSIQCFHCEGFGHIARDCTASRVQVRHKNAKIPAKINQPVLHSTKPKKKIKENHRITKLEALANELLLDIFQYLSIVHLLYAFDRLNSRFQSLLFVQFPTCYLDFQCIKKQDMSTTCRRYLPLFANRIMSLRLSDSNARSKQTDFLPSFGMKLPQFQNLRSLSLYNVHSEQVMQKMMIEWTQLPNLTYLKLIKCYASFGRSSTTSLSNTIWTLPKLTHYCVDTEHHSFCMPTLISTSLEYVAILGHRCRLNELSQLLEKTPLLRGLSIGHRDLNDNQYLSSSIPSITTLKLYDLRSRAVMMNLLENMLNLSYLSVETFYINLDGHQWEQIINHYLLKLRVFRLKMDLQLVGSMNNELLVDALLDSFRSPFWLEQHQWFVRCHRQSQANHSNVLLYTLPLVFRNYDGAVIRLPYKSTEQSINNIS